MCFTYILILDQHIAIVSSRQGFNIYRKPNEFDFHCPFRDNTLIFNWFKNVSFVKRNFKFF